MENQIKIFNSEQSKMVSIHSEGEMINLTDLWKENGSIETKAPKFWLSNEETKGFIKAVSKMLKVTETYLLNVKRGRNGGTWGHKQIALEYAQYLDAKLGVMVNQVFFERVEEEKNPEKIIDRVYSTYERQGKTIKWIEERIKGKVTRNSFTRTLAAHGVEQQGFRDCTNAIYKPLFGGSASVIRDKKGLEKTQNVRDNMSNIELAAVGLAELLAEDLIEKNNLKGNGKCEVACSNSSTAVKNAVIQSRKSLSLSNTF